MITLMVPEPIIERLNAHAVSLGVSRSALIRMAIVTVAKASLDMRGYRGVRDSVKRGRPPQKKRRADR